MHFLLNRHLRPIPQDFTEGQLRAFFVKTLRQGKEQDEVSQTEPEEEEEEEEFEVEGKFLHASLACVDKTLTGCRLLLLFVIGIMGWRHDSHGVQRFLVKWKNYPFEKSTWERE
jgi:hypothetical protein